MAVNAELAVAPMLAVDNLEIWRGPRRLFTQLFFDARAGDLVHLKGPNGSGKTTLLRCLAGLSLPDGGSISWFGRRYTARVGADARARCHFVGHHEALKGGLDVVENLRALNALHGGDDSLIEPVLSEAGLSGRRGIPAQQLSAGQRRRAALSRLRTGAADAWLLDEPFTSLDVEGIALAARWITAHIEGGGLVVLSTHQPLPPTLHAVVIDLGERA